MSGDNYIVELTSAQSGNPEIPLAELAAAGWDLPLRVGPWGALDPPGCSEYE